MSSMARFPDWSGLTPAERRAVRTNAPDRARRLEPRLNAFVGLAPSIPPESKGVLEGCPYAAKDIFCTSGRRPTGGLHKPLDMDCARDAEVLRRLDDAGATRIGFAAMPELAYEPSGHNTARGRTKNPWNTDFIAGGSSSGSAAAVAGASVVFALGSDTGGSLRIPAHCCGVTAWKPTFGLVPITGVMPLAPTLDTIGLLARSAADMAAAARIAADVQASPQPVRRAVVLADLMEVADAPVRRACQDGIDAVASCGIALQRREPSDAIQKIDPHALVVMQAEAARVHRRYIDDPSLDAILRKRLSKGLTIDDGQLAASKDARATLAADFLEQVLGRAELALLPVMAMRTPPVSECDPAAATFRPRTLYDLGKWTRFVNMLGFPAVAIPVGFDDRGLPVALQLLGRPNSDLSLLALAEAVQRKTDWHGRIPTAISDLQNEPEV
jgi:aspartyl-tRNA(Asn)/glutamyl-tRNA(Gln) amidotransferase subunit A